MPSPALLLALLLGAGAAAATAPVVVDTAAPACEATPLLVVQLGDSHTAGGYATHALAGALSASSTTTATTAPPTTTPGTTTPVWGYVPPDSDTTGFATGRLVGRWTKRTWLHDDGGRAGPGGRVATPGSGRAEAILDLRPTLPPTGPAPPTDAATSTAPAPSTTATTTATAPTSAANVAPLLPAGGWVTVLHDAATPLRAGSVRVDDVAVAPLTTTTGGEDDARGLGRTRFALPAGARRVVLDATGTTLGLFGWVVEEAGAAIAVDALGVVGVTTAQAARRASPALEEYLGWRRPDVVIVWLGTNDAVTDERERAAFPEVFAAWIARVRAAAPTAALVVLGPPDLGRRPAGCATPPRRKRGRLGAETVRALVCRPSTLTPADPRQAPALGLRGVRSGRDWQKWVEGCGHQPWPAVQWIAEQERAVAERLGAVFFDVQGFMGGPGAMHGWACAEPPLASLDHVHLRPEGYAAVGRALAARIAPLLTSAPRCATTATNTTATNTTATNTTATNTTATNTTATNTTATNTTP